MLVHILQHPTEEPSQMDQGKQLSHQPAEKRGFQLRVPNLISLMPKTISTSNVTRCEYPTRIQHPQTRCFRIPFAFTNQIFRDVITLVICQLLVDVSPISADSSNQAPALRASHARSTGSRGPKCHRFFEPSKMRRRPSLCLGSSEVGIPLLKSLH